jgi:undecaprenyl diphosphate synthase
MTQKIPNCIGIIMDGNRRYAKNKNLPAVSGHKAGGETLKEVIKWAKDAGINHVIFYTFSTENWGRPTEEVDYLMKLISSFIKTELEHLTKDGVVHFVGDLKKFNSSLQKDFIEISERTKNNKGINIYFALNYGGRQEILNAVKNIMKEKPEEKDITEQYFKKYLQTSDMPDPDIVIRTSGEMRLSGFLPWQTVYSELFFTKTLWPEFSREEFFSILSEYDKRERRVGK